ncbi:MAG: response regulator [Labilithrix sp.]|nr:response regulator [Labilithrix sp.]
MAPILIIEDDDEIREILAEMLVDTGYEVDTARNGREGLERLRADLAAPRLVLLDLMMPVMDGWQLRREMLADPELAAIPVVVLSGAADVEATSSGLGVKCILTKPVKWAALLESVKTFAR